MKQPTQESYVMDVLLRNYCRTSEENDLLYEEIDDLRTTMKALFQENADIRFILKKAGLEPPPSEFVIISEDFEDDEIKDDHL